MRRFGRFRLDSAARALFRDDAVVPLPPKAVAVLAALAAANGEVLSRDALIDAVWPGEDVLDGALTQAVYLVRRALADGGLSAAIVTVPKRGYRFVPPPPSAAPEPVAPSESTARLRQPRRRVYVPALAIAGIVAAIAIGFVDVRSHAGAAATKTALDTDSARIYALGRADWSSRTRAGLERSLALFRDVARRAPSSSLGYAGLADAELGVFDYLCDPRDCAKYAGSARVYAAEALARDPDSPAALTSAAQVARVADRNDLRAEALFRRAIDRDSRYALAHEWYGNLLLMRGRTDEARRQLEAAAALEPAAPATYAWLARLAYVEHRYGDAVALARETLVLVPDRVETRLVLGLALARGGHARAAAAAFDELSRHGGSATEARLLDLALPGATRAPPPVHGEFAADVACIWIARGDRTRALTALSAATFGDETARRLFALDPRLDAVRTDPRFRRWTRAE